MDDIVYPEFSSFYTDDNAFEDKITCHISKWDCIPGLPHYTNTKNS